MITKVVFEKFTAFERLAVMCSPGINVFVGANGTGKTHILKTAYAACDITTSKKSFPEKIATVFLPSGGQIGRLVKRSVGRSSGHAEVCRRSPGSDDEIKLRVRITTQHRAPEKATVTGAQRWSASELKSVYIPVKEMLSNAPGFRSLYASREIAFEEVYADIVDRALLPLLKGPAGEDRRRILSILEKAMAGKVVVNNEEFFLRNKQGKLEFTLLAEGLRKLGLLWVLVQNGTLLGGSVLFWDEPEANLNPNMMETVVKILLELRRMGVQVFLATHDYILLKELDLQMQDSDKVVFHSLYRDAESGEIAIKSTPDYLQIHPNAIADTFSGLYDRDVQRALGGVGQCS